MNFLKLHLKAIIFDMDGTIINSESKWSNAVKKYVNKFDHGLDEEAQHKILGNLDGAGLYHSASTIKKNFFIKSSIRDIVDEIKNMAIQDLASGVDFINGFQTFQQHLSTHNIKRGIATNADAHSFEQLSNHLGFKNMFGEHLYCIDHIGGIAKPNPAIFLHTAKQLNVAPEDCIVFEDSIFGFKAAKAAGMKCIAIKNEKNKDLLQMVHGSIDHYDQAIDELYKVLGLAKP